MENEQTNPSQGESLTNQETQSHPTRHQSDHAIRREAMASPTGERARSTNDIPLVTDKSHMSREESNTSKTGGQRQSTQLSRGRQSTEFDRRYDGPFGRPSIAMSRRTFSLQLDANNEDGDEPPVPTIPAEFAAAGDAARPVERLGFEPEPPPLHYDLWSRKWWIVFFWSIVVFDTSVCPVALYFGLWYGLRIHDKMTPNTVFSIVTAAVGGMSIVEYVLRFWKLVKKDSTCRAIGAKRWYFDWFHWNFSLGWIIIMIELIVGTIQKDPPPRLLAMCVPSMCFVFAIETLTMDFLRYFQIPAPLRFSSVPKGSQVRPGIYSIIEDIVAVDGSGGTAYRENLNKRYEASHVFRAMLRRLGLFWSIGSMAMAVVCTILVFTIQVDAAYTVGWTAPFIWGGVWALITLWYVKRKLKEEKLAWAEEIAEKVPA